MHAPDPTSRTASMLRRIPVILAVTAASYGLEVPQHALRWSAGGGRPGAERHQRADSAANPSSTASITRWNEMGLCSTGTCKAPK